MKPFRIALWSLLAVVVVTALAAGGFALWLHLAANHKGAEDQPTKFYEPPTTPAPRGTAQPRFTIGRLGDRWQILDSQGRVALFRGVNVGEGAMTPPWQPIAPGDSAAFAQLRSWGVNAIRFVLPWEALEPAPRQINLDHIAYVRWFLDEANRHGMVVVLDNHQADVSRCFGGAGAPVWAHRPGVVADADQARDCRYHGRPGLADLPGELRWWADFWDATWTPDDLALQDHAIAAWTKLAEVLRGHPGLLGYGPFNEPRCHHGRIADAFYPGQVRCEDAVSDYYRRFANSLRSVDPDALIFFETPGKDTRDHGQDAAADVRRPPVDGVVFAAHYRGSDDRGSACDGRWDRRDCDLASFLEASRERATKEFQSPVVLAEFGVNPCSQGAAEELSHQMVDIEDAGVSAFLWSYFRTGESRGMSGPREGGEDRSLVVPEVRATDPSQVGRPRCFAASFPRPYPSRLAGTLESYGFDRSYESWRGAPDSHHDGRPVRNTDEFTLTFRQGEVVADSFVWVPRTSVYGDDPSTEVPEFTVDVSDGHWRWSDLDPNLLIWTAGSGHPVHTLRIKPWGGRRAPGNGIGPCE